MNYKQYTASFKQWVKNINFEQYYLGFFHFLINLLFAIAIFYLGRFFIKLLLKLYRKIYEKNASHFNQSIYSFLYSLINGSLYLVLILIILRIIGVNAASLIAVLGTAGIGIGLALKDNLSNLASGFMLLIIRPFNIGDKVKISSYDGVILEINILTTTLRNPLGSIISINNSFVMGNPIENFTRYGKRCVNLLLPINISVPFENVYSICMNVIKEHHIILNNPEPVVCIQEMTPLQYHVKLSFWVIPTYYTSIQSIILEILKSNEELIGYLLPEKIN